MTTPTQHLEIFDEKFGYAHKNELKQHLIQTVISVLEEQIKLIEAIVDMPPPYSADPENPKKHWYQNEGYRKGLEDSIRSLTATISTFESLL